MTQEQSQFLNISDIMDTQEIWSDFELYKDSQVKDSKGYAVCSSAQNNCQGFSGKLEKGITKRFFLSGYLFWNTLYNRDVEIVVWASIKCLF